MNTKVYLSGGMNESNWQKTVIDAVDCDGYIFFNPREHNLIDSKQYTFWDLYYVDKCDIVFAYMQEENPSGYGLTLEIGYAKALNKPIILVDEKSHLQGNFSRYFKIVKESSTVVFENLGEGIELLKKLRHGVIDSLPSRSR